MKNTIKTVAMLALLSGVSQAAVTISGTVGTSVKGSDGSTNIPVGSLYLIIADTGVAGFLKDGSAGITGGLNGLGSLQDPGLEATSASILAGGNFGGDLILATGNTTTAGVLPFNMTNIGIGSALSKNFAIIWFEKSAVDLGAPNGLNNAKYGILSLADWTLPSADSGSFTMNSTDSGGAASYFTTSGTITGAQLGSGFFTGSGTAGDATADIKAATFTLVGIPEPSAALLGAIGALGLLRRRRI